MRYLVLALFIIVSQWIHAAEDAGIREFAEQYWAAIKSNDSEKILSFIDPRVFERLTPGESAFMKETWINNYNKVAEQQGDSYGITTKDLPPGSGLPFPKMRWAAAPEYQIEVQTFKNVGNGREGLYGLVELAVKRDGRFYIIRPVPPSEVLQKRMGNK